MAFLKFLVCGPIVHRWRGWKAGAIDMKTKIILSFFILIFLLAACGQGTAAPAPVTHTLVMTQPPTDIPTQTATTYFMPLGPTSPPSPTAMPPYPTASTVKENAVAFIAEKALWIANVDGSGERKLVDVMRNEDSVYNRMLQWSPNGKWISYFSQDKLWVVSRDGLINSSLLSLPDKSVAYLIRYAWSPDSSKIAYLELSYHKPAVTPTPRPEGGDSGIASYLVGMIDIATGNVSELSSFEANAGIPILLWSPNGRDLLFIKDYSLVLFDVTTNKIVKTIKRGCGLERDLSWSPNGRWFSYTDNGVGGFNTTWICVNGPTSSSIQKIFVDSTSHNPVWDKTGNYLYFLASKIDLTRKSDWLIDERLMRYDVRTQETESLFSLKEQQQSNSYIRFLSISPDGKTLMLQSESSQTKYDLIFVDVQSLATTKFNLDLESPPDLFFRINPVWSPDNHNVIFYFYRRFYSLNRQTGKVSIISGDHPTENWAVSPIATTP
jgi:Tol biopolymer transport system component